jgi:hypothetical protein
MSASSSTLYPRATAALKALVVDEAGGATLSSFRAGPAIMRAPPALRARGAPASLAPASASSEGSSGAQDMGDLLGELVDLVLVGADDSESRHPEVHLQFKADVWGGLHLRLQKTPAGLVARFLVADGATRRAVVDHIEALLERLRGRGFAIVEHSVDVVAR